MLSKLLNHCNLFWPLLKIIAYSIKRIRICTDYFKTKSLAGRVEILMTICSISSTYKWNCNIQEVDRCLRSFCSEFYSRIFFIQISMNFLSFSSPCSQRKKNNLCTSTKGKISVLFCLKFPLLTRPQTVY